MNRITHILLLLVIIATGTLTVTAQAPAEKPRPFFSALKAGQPVSLKEVAGRYEISTLEGVPGIQGYKVLEIGSDYLVLQDISGINEFYIPVWSIKAIIKVKLPGK